MPIRMVKKNKESKLEESKIEESKEEENFIGKRQCDQISPSLSNDLHETLTNLQLFHFDDVSIFYVTSQAHFTTQSYCNQSSASIFQGSTSSSLSYQWTPLGQDVQ